MVLLISTTAFGRLSTSEWSFLKPIMLLYLSFIDTLVWLLLVSVTKAAPSLTRREAPPQSTACGNIVRNATVNQFFASEVYECLTSVPFNAAVASRFIKYYKDSVQFQSTLSYLKTPPETYLQPPIDLLVGLDVIQTKVDSGIYKNQYEFEASLQRLVYSAHDDHLDIAAGILGVFAFGTSYRIVSVSTDGIELPQVYVGADIFQSQQDGGVWKPSPIATLDGEEVVTYLTRFAADNAVGGRESHADWQQLMSSPAQAIQGIASIWSGEATFYPGEDLVIGFRNGTKLTTPWYGVFLGDSETGPLETGGDFYNSFVLGFWPASYEPVLLTGEEAVKEAGSEGGVYTPIPEPPRPTATTAPTPRRWNNGAYPSPIIAQENLGELGGGFLSGYFLPGNIAVLSIPSFQEYGDTVDEFSLTVGRFINAAHSQGMKKIVIDLQRNYGGDALLAIDTFKQFFPKIDPYGGSNLRAHPAANIMGKTMTDYFERLPQDHKNRIYLYTKEWVASTRMSAETNQPFTSWEEFYGSHAAVGDGFTTTQRYNLSDPLFDSLALESYIDRFIVSGYDKTIDESPQLFAAEDILILTDGICASACSMFVESMHNEAGVKTVTVGGRPQYGPIQAVGQTRGVRIYGIDTQLDRDIADTQTTRGFTDQPADFFVGRSTALDVEVTYSTLNLRNQVRKGEIVPLQFQYDAADCRIFFTPATVINFTNLWTYVADAMWTKPELCVKDSTGYARTDAKSTELPPADLLPAIVPAPEPEVKLGSIISSIFNSDSGPGPGIEAYTDKGTSGSKPSHPVSKWPPDECDWNGRRGQYTCKDPNKFCDVYFGLCSTNSPGKQITYPGCVDTCKSKGRPCEEWSTGGSCRDTGVEPSNQLKDTPRGFCASPGRRKSYCDNNKPDYRDVQMNNYQLVNNRKREEDG